MAQHSRNFFSIKKIGQYFRNCKPLSAQDTDGWRGCEHVGWLFADGNSTLQKLLRTHLFCLTFWETFLQNILMNFQVAGCLRSKRQTTHCTPSPLALSGVNALHVLKLRKCATMCYFLYVTIFEFHCARGSEAQRAEAAARHQGRSKYRVLIHQNEVLRILP